MTWSPPVIGITTYGRDESNRFSLPGDYADAVRRAGAVPMLIPPGETQIDRLITSLDGLVLAGGGDINPELYGGALHETVYNLDSERDKAELAIARQALDSRLPMFAICRGTQIVNVLLGGTLFEHLPDHVGEAECTVASWHHQAIRRLADGLQVVARAFDGTIEAVEMLEHPGLIAVQWHPELTAARDPAQQRLFDTFVRNAVELRAR
jgi:putative glutamine amidotransferase